MTVLALRTPSEWWAPVLRAAALPYAAGAIHVLAVAVYFLCCRGSFLGGDSGDYLAIGKALATGLYEQPGVDRAVGYPLVLSLAYRLAPGTPVAAAVLFNYGFYFLTIYWVGRLARSLGLGVQGRRLAQLLFALIPNMAIFANLVMTEILAALLLCVGTDMLLRYLSPGRKGMEASSGRLSALGAATAALALVRTEYLFVLPALLAVRAAGSLRRSPGTARVGGLGILAAGVGFLAVLLAVTVYVRYAGPPGITIGASPSLFYRSLWLSFYDRELNHFRLHAVNRLSERLDAVGDDEIERRLNAVRLDYTGGSPLRDETLEAIRRDLASMRAYAVSMDEEQRRSGLPYLRVFEGRLAGQSLEYLARAVVRALYAVAAVDTDWPTFRNRLIHSATIMPVSVGAYLSWLLLIWRRTPLHGVTLVALPAAYSAVVHGLLVYDQRYVLPSVPLLCVLCALGIRSGLGLLRARGA